MTHCDRSSKDARLAFYQTADVKKLKYDDIAPEIVSEVDPECLEALIKLLIAMLEVRFLNLKKISDCIFNLHYTQCPIDMLTTSDSILRFLKPHK